MEGRLPVVRMTANAASVHHRSPVAAKIIWFRLLFRGQEDVYCRGTNESGDEDFGKRLEKHLGRLLRRQEPGPKTSLKPIVM